MLLSKTVITEKENNFLTDSDVQFTRSGYAIFLTYHHLEKSVMGMLHCMLFNRVSAMENGIHWSDSNVQLYKSAYEIFPIPNNFGKNTTKSLQHNV
jgi:hypothetical protein